MYYKSRVTKTTIRSAYGMADLLVEVGSCLGLWLGVSVIGLYDVTTLGVPRISAWFNLSIKHSYSYHLLSSRDL